MSEEKTNILSTLAESLSTLAEGFKKFRDETFHTFKTDTEKNHAHLEGRIQELENKSGTKAT